MYRPTSRRSRSDQTRVAALYEAACGLRDVVRRRIHELEKRLAVERRAAVRRRVVLERGTQEELLALLEDLVADLGSAAAVEVARRRARELELLEVRAWRT